MTEKEVTEVVAHQEANSPPLSRGLTFAMAAATGLAVANVYYNQPMLGVIERDLPGPFAVLVPTATQLGFAIGLFLLVPLGDLVERRRLIVLQFVLLAGALAIAATAGSAAWLLFASLLIGVTATTAQQIVPFAADLAMPERRGAVVGTVMSGLLGGILLSRTVAGLVATHAGWRAMFALGVPLALAAAALMAWRLPRSRPRSDLGYGALLASLGGLWRELPALQLAAVTQALLFGAFTIFWTILALHLQEPRYDLGADVAGLFGIVGAVGIVAAPIAGRIADRRGPSTIILAGSALTLASWVLCAAWDSIAGLIVGTILLDFAVQSALVSNQHVIYGLRPDARSRINTLFMGAMFVGGAAGAAGGAIIWKTQGWAGVSWLGMGFAAGAVGLQAVGWRAQIDDSLRC